jgi:hypothetical protein
MAAATLTACGSDDKPAATTAASAPVVISVVVGTDSSPDRVEKIPLGAQVTLTLTDPNGDEEYHVHGYELGDGEEVAKGEPKVFTFTADKAGTFEVESHKTETVLVQLEVS